MTFGHKQLCDLRPRIDYPVSQGISVLCPEKKTVGAGFRTYLMKWSAKLFDIQSLIAVLYGKRYDSLFVAFVPGYGYRPLLFLYHLHKLQCLSKTDVFYCIIWTAAKMCLKV